MRRSISTCMRNAVAGFSIMWVYKRARARSMHFVNGTRRPVTHILQVENTRSGPARTPLLRRAGSMKGKKKSTGSSIYFTVLRLRRRYDGGDFSASGRAIPSGYQLSMRFSRARHMVQLSGKCAATRRGKRCSRDRDRARRNYVFIIARLLFALTTNDFYAISMESTGGNLILFNGKSCVTQF